MSDEDVCCAVTSVARVAWELEPKQLLSAFVFATKSGWNSAENILQEEILERLWRLEDLLD